MAKPLANHVTAGKAHNRQIHIAKSILTSWLLLPDSQASTLSAKVTVKDMLLVSVCVGVYVCVHACVC